MVRVTIIQADFPTSLRKKHTHTHKGKLLNKVMTQVICKPLISRTMIGYTAENKGFHPIGKLL